MTRYERQTNQILKKLIDHFAEQKDDDCLLKNDINVTKEDIVGYLTAQKTNEQSKRTTGFHL